MVLCLSNTKKWQGLASYVIYLKIRIPGWYCVTFFLNCQNLLWSHTCKILSVSKYFKIMEYFFFCFKIGGSVMVFIILLWIRYFTVKTSLGKMLTIVTVIEVYWWGKTRLLNQKHFPPASAAPCVLSFIF